jgi:hypothetical protein
MALLSAGCRLGQVLLYETGTEVHIKLDEGCVAYAAEAVDLAGLDDQYVARARLEFRSIDRPQAAALSHELDLVVWMTMGPGTTPGQGVEEEHRDIHVSVVRPDEVVRAATEG